MILRSAKKYFRIALEMRVAVVDWLLDVMRLVSLDLSVFRHVIPRMRECRDIAQREGERMIVASACNRRALKKSVRRVRRTAVLSMERIRQVG